MVERQILEGIVNEDLLICGCDNGVGRGYVDGLTELGHHADGDHESLDHDRNGLDDAEFAIDPTCICAY